MRFRSLSVGCVVSLAAACAEDERAPSDRDRAWGRDHARQAIEVRAAVPLPPDAFVDRSDVRARILGMRFREVVARFGPVRFEGDSSFRMRRNGHDVEVVEQTRIESGPDGDVRVVQRDADDRLLREAIRAGGHWYVRHEAGELQTTDYVQRHELRVDEQAFEPLATTSSLLEPAIRWRRVERRSFDGRPALGFRATPAPLADPVEAEGFEAPLELDAVEGVVWVDTETSIVLAAELDAALRFPNRGRLAIRTKHRIRPIEPEPFDVAEASDPPPRAPVDLRPLSFLDELTRTSTVIGGDEPER